MLALAGDWRLERGLISGAALERELARPPMPKRIAFDAAKLGEWDSNLADLLRRQVGELLQRQAGR